MDTTNSHDVHSVPWSISGKDLLVSYQTKDRLSEVLGSFFIVGQEVTFVCILWRSCIFTRFCSATSPTAHFSHKYQIHTFHTGVQYSYSFCVRYCPSAPVAYTCTDFMRAVLAAKYFMATCMNIAYCLYYADSQTHRITPSVCCSVCVTVPKDNSVPNARSEQTRPGIQFILSTWRSIQQCHNRELISCKAVGIYRKRQKCPRLCQDILGKFDVN